MRFTSTGQRAMSGGDKDYRYTIRVYLLREDRPNYWDFHCNSCGKKVCEMNGTMVYVTDITSDGVTTGLMVTNRVRVVSSGMNLLTYR